MTIVKLLKVHFQCIFRYPELHMVIHVYVCVIDELSLIPFTFNTVLNAQKKSVYLVTAEKVGNPNLQTDVVHIKTGVTGLVRNERYRKAKPFMKDIATPSSMAKLNVILCILQSFWQKMKAKNGILMHFWINYSVDFIECQHQLSYS